nr:class I SAM-dependent RNA methyltransferase [uncultured Desulfobulbus sp.]
MEHTLTIHKLIHGGKGLGTLADGMVVMVPGALPGEQVTVRETKKHRGHMEAELITVDKTAPERITPPCPYYGQCGGCNLQHAEESSQLRFKEEILQESLQRAGIVLTPEQQGVPLASPQSFGYRHRIRLHLDHQGNLGYHQNATNQVVPIRRCLLAAEPINEVLETLVDKGIAAKLAGSIDALELLLSPADGALSLVFHPLRGVSAKSLAGYGSLLKDLVQHLVIEQKKGDQPYQQAAHLAQDFSVGELIYRLRWSTGCFFQVNVAQNARLIELTMEVAQKLERPFTLLDLFCGMGNFSLPFALSGAKIFGIDQNRESIAWAEANSDALDVETRYKAADVGQQLQRLVRKERTFDCILLDPPRQGLGKTAALLPQLSPQMILSISCDPATHARDLKAMMEGGYHLVQITPIDMFPQTHHIESLAVLERN